MALYEIGALYAGWRQHTPAIAQPRKAEVHQDRFSSKRFFLIWGIFTVMVSAIQMHFIHRWAIHAFPKIDDQTFNESLFSQAMWERLALGFYMLTLVATDEESRKVICMVRTGS